MKNLDIKSRVRRKKGGLVVLYGEPESHYVRIYII